jgi:type I restriction enzyme, S subunit
MKDNNTSGAKDTTEKEIMKLPEGWTWTTLQEAAKINGRDPEIRNLADDLPVTFVPMAAVDATSGTISNPVVRPLKEVRKGFTPFSNGDVIIAKITPCMENGKAAIAKNLFNGRGFGSTEFHVFRPKEGLLPEYLYHFIRQESFRNDAKAQFAGTAGQLRVPASFLYDYPMPLPPLSEQERIVTRLEELLSDLDAGVASLQRVRAGLKRYKASVLKAACEGKLTGVGEDGLPEGWRWVTVGEVAEHRLGKMLDKEKNKGELRPYLRNINIRWFTFDLSDIQYMRVLESELESISVKKGDLIICEGGEPGRAAVWNQEKSFVIQKALHRVRFTREVVPIFLTYRLSTDAAMGKLEKYFTGSTIKHFTGQSLHNYRFPLPPLEEQHRIVAEVEQRLESVKAVDAGVEAGLKRAARLRQAILKQAFEGRL